MKRIIAIVGLFVLSIVVKERLHAQDETRRENVYEAATGTHSAFVSTQAQNEQMQKKQEIRKS